MTTKPHLIAALRALNDAAYAAARAAKGTDMQRTIVAIASATDTLVDGVAP